MKKTLLLLLLLSPFMWLNAQVLYEDFESGTTNGAAGALNGTFNGVVANPDPDAVNSSALVASYTNNPLVDYNFFVDTLTAPVDLTKFNLIKMKVWSPIDSTRVLFKFQGPDGAVEFIRNITVDSQWVEYTFDVSGGASFTMMNLILISFAPGTLGSSETFYFDDIIAVEPVIVYEDFEPMRLTWQGLDGVFTGPVANFDSSAVNGSDSVGCYVKSGVHAYSLLLADLGQPFDMGVLNQFHLQIHAEAPTQVLMKLEGPGGPAIEKTKNIGLTNEWQEYTFDFSAAADWTHLTKIILFFDPGVETSADTYYFDNLTATGLGVCRGVMLDADIVDDFECNRNATYVNGWDSLRVANNPAPNAVNSSAKVGCYTDPLGEQWAALVMDYQNPIDLGTKNQLHVKIWAPREVPILFKLEGGASTAKEIWMTVPAAGEWINYQIDFSSEAINSHKKLVIFFNAGQDPQPGDVYYIDDIRWAVQTIFVVEDFEGGAFLPWEPLFQQTVVHGEFAVVANPDASGANQSAQVGEYKKGTSGFSTLAAVAPGFIDISTRPQFNVDVYAPDTVIVIFQLESVSQGNKEVQRRVPLANEWVTLSFDFTDYQGITDWESIRLIFNPGVEEQGATYYFDNVTQSERTIDPCEGVAEVENLIDDFECQRNNGVLAGAEFLSVVGNPQVDNNNQSTYVGLYEDQPNEPWQALCYDFPDGIDLSSFNQLSIQILSDEAVPVLLKLEGGPTPAEVWSAYTTPGQWETVTADFANQVGQDHRRACFFFNGGVATTEVDNYYIDNVEFAHAPFTGCLINFDDAAFISDVWSFFPLETTGSFELVDNPDPSGINTSAKVGKATERAVPEAEGGASWAGLYTNLPAQIVFSDNKLVRMKVWSPQITTITMKIESSLTPAPPGSGDVTIPNTKVNEWEELTWDFSGTPITDDGYYDRVTLIFDIANIPTSDVVYYFDDVALTGGECAVSSIGGGPVRPGDLSITPNPVTSDLRINELGNVTRLDVINLYGQRVASFNTNAASSMYIQVGDLHQGAYILGGYNDKGELIAITRFVKL